MAAAEADLVHASVLAGQASVGCVASVAGTVAVAVQRAPLLVAAWGCLASARGSSLLGAAAVGEVPASVLQGCTLEAAVVHKAAGMRGNAREAMAAVPGLLG